MHPSLLVRSTPVRLHALRVVVAIVVIASAGGAVRADGPEAEPGLGSDGLPAIERVGVARGLPADSGALAATLRYGLTESVLDQGESHHRVGVLLGGGYALAEGLALALELDGRVHAQSGGDDGGDSGFLARTRVGLRAAAALGPALRGGAELRVQLPAAASLGSALKGSSPELVLLGSYAPSARVLASAMAGFRLDRAAEAIDHADRISASDRVALGVADDNAVVLGLGLEARLVGRMSVLGEWSWEPRVGGDQGALESPMYVTAGVRLRASDALQWRASLSYSPSERPDLATAPVLVALEPRLWIALGATVLLSPAPPPPPPTPAVVQAPEPEPEVAPVVAPVVVRGQVVREDGVPVAGAALRVTAGEQTLETATDAEGRFELPPLPTGSYPLEVSADGFRTRAMPLEVGGQAPAELGLSLQRALPEGHIRGQVQSFSGRPIASSVRIEPLGIELQTDAEGRFDVDVPPGDYRVSVEAPGYRAQERPAQVEQGGVTVLLIELRRARK